MLTCLACAKLLGNAVEADSAREYPVMKEPGKSLTSQIKEMVLKLSGSTQQCNFQRKREEEIKCSADGLGFQGGGGLFLKKEGKEDASFNVLIEDDKGEPKEWMALVEPGVLITFISLPGGGNDLKRIRFSREMFDKWQAQRWWGENYDRIIELYNVHSFTRQGLRTPPRSDNELFNVSAEADVASRTTASSSDLDAAEWVLQDDPGVFVTVRHLPDGSRELRRVKFSRQYFSEDRAKRWWEENWKRIQAQYIRLTGYGCQHSSPLMGRTPSAHWRTAGIFRARQPGA